MGDRTLPGEGDVSPKLVPPGRVVLPARFVAEAFGYEVGWDAAASAVLVGPPGKLPQASEFGPGEEASVPLRYVVTITPADAAEHRARVSLVLSAPGDQASVDLAASAQNGGPAGPGPGEWITVAGAHDRQGRPLTVQGLGGGRFRVYTGSSPEVVVEYEAELAIPRPGDRDLFLTYLDANAGVVYAGALLLRPPSAGPALVDFRLPEDWAVVAGEGWQLAGRTGYLVSAGGASGYIALGPWEVHSDGFGQGQTLTVALAGKTRYRKDSYVPAFRAAADYLSLHLGPLPSLRGS